MRLVQNLGNFAFFTPESTQKSLWECFFSTRKSALNVKKGRKSGNRHFWPFFTCFLPKIEQKITFLEGNRVQLYWNIANLLLTYYDIIPTFRVRGCKKIEIYAILTKTRNLMGVLLLIQEMSKRGGKLAVKYGINLKKLEFSFILNLRNRWFL